MSSGIFCYGLSCSSLDPTLAPAGHHVCLLFTQYCPYSLAGGRQWDEAARKEYGDLVIDTVRPYI